MKLIFLHFIFIIFAPDIFCNDSLISKFHQNTFKVKDSRMVLISYNKSYFHHIEMKTFKYNRTTTAHNFTFNLKISIEDKLEVVVQDYKFLSNEYRYFPIRFQLNMKKSVDANLMGLSAVKNCGNISTLYFYKDITYHGCNFVPDESHFPPLIPNGKFKFEFIYLYLGVEIAQVDFYHEIYTPMKYPKA